jgi:hypothetical protein
MCMPLIFALSGILHVAGHRRAGIREGYFRQARKGHDFRSERKKLLGRCVNVYKEC